MLGLHFIQTNKLSRDLGRFYSDLYDKRQTGDYDDFVEFDEATVVDLQKSAEAFVTAIESLVEI
jgi:uncharacterized protein (UPF0332 family)